MRKRDELNNPDSCLSKAGDNEMMFILLARDEDAPETIRDWIKRRIKRGKDQPGDAKMVEAEHCAQIMEHEQRNKS